MPRGTGDRRVGHGHASAGESGRHRMFPRVEPFGDGALLVTFSEKLELRANDLAQQLAARIEAWRLEAASDVASGAPRGAAAFREPVAAHASVLVPYDAERLDGAVAIDLVGPLVSAVSMAPLPDGSAGDETSRLLEIPVVYGGENGPDLAVVAATTGLTEREVVELHTASIYRVLLLGFAPGFAYLGLLPPSLRVPRRTTPRPRVSAGSVAIAGRQTAVYPFETPGGWHLIGRTSLPMWDSRRDPPNTLSPGQRVRFRPVAEG